MKTIINEITGSWTNAKNKCRTTVNKDATDNKPKPKFIKDLLISEHSPIRLISVDWSWNSIPYWLSTEWSRHKFEKFISTQRKDRTGINRSDSPQATPVKFDGYANAQSLIDVWRKRLCGQATIEAQQLARDFKRELHSIEPELSEVLVPNCIYRGGCPEFQECGFWSRFKLLHPNIDMTSIRERYDIYNVDFFKRNN